MRHVNGAGLELIKRFEGFSPIPYADVAGKMTVGYGHLIRHGERWECISEHQAEALLRRDLVMAERAVERFITCPLGDDPFAALVSFTFNMGVGALQRSTLRQKINRGEHEDVPQELRRWVWAGGKRWSGLLRRREAEIALYQKGNSSLRA